MKKALNIIRTVFTYFIVALAVCMMIFTLVSVNTFDKNDRSIFGYKAFIVLSDSMSKTDFDAGDLVLVKWVDPSTLQPGDIIAYTSQNQENYGATVTHKIRSLATDENGNPGFITYGTTTDIDDEIIVTYPYVNGKYQTHIPKVGTFFTFLKTTPGYFVFIFTPIFILILMQAINCFQLFRQYKKEQMDEIHAEQEKIAEERAETQRMMQELMQLKAQLNGAAPAPNAQVPPQNVQVPAQNVQIPAQNVQIPTQSAAPQTQAAPARRPTAARAVRTPTSPAAKPDEPENK